MSKRMISFEIPDELREQLRVEAFERKLAISATIREILEQYFEDKLKNGKGLEGIRVYL